MNKEVDNLQKLGYLNIDIDPVLNLFEEIEKLKIEKSNCSCALLSRE